MKNEEAIYQRWETIAPGCTAAATHRDKVHAHPARGRRGPLSTARPLGWWLLVATLLAACGGPPPVSLGPGVKAEEPPLQESIQGPAILRGAVEMTPRASFTIRARLLAKRRYRWDHLSSVAPWDFALGWGLMSDESLTRGTRVLQGDRLMYWHLYDAPLAVSVVEQSSANIHLIGATDAVSAQFSQVPRGALVTLEGRLVDLRLEDRSIVRTSLTRHDRGVGACEILLVDAISWTTDA